MAVDADAVNVYERMAAGQLLDGGLLVGHPVSAQVAAAVVVVPNRPLRIAAAIADLDNNEAELVESDPVIARRERLGHALGLRAGVDEGDDGILPVRVEIERLVHHAVKIGNAVVGFDLEWFG